MLLLLHFSSPKVSPVDSRGRRRNEMGGKQNYFPKRQRTAGSFKCMLRRSSGVQRLVHVPLFYFFFWFSRLRIFFTNTILYHVWRPVVAHLNIKSIKTKCLQKGKTKIQWKFREGSEFESWANCRTKIFKLYRTFDNLGQENISNRLHFQWRSFQKQDSEQVEKQ